jgi:hypothetical protein
MSPRSRIFALVLVVLLVVPFLVRNDRTGSVLGVLEDNSGSVAMIGDSGGQIAGGVLENKSTQDKNSQPSAVLTGQAVLDKDALVAVSTDRFALASEIEITYKDVTIDKIVGNNKQALKEGQVVILDQKTFIELGIDPSLGSAEVQIKAVK